ncbi:MAG TPA: thiol-disulfide oxidoreductase [Blastocatellia bacterium]|nr:thiol-disulfide oxidoreductase [Blastocatellia bacterium]
MSGIVLFDGICNFCNGSVNFIIERDNAGYFRFAPLQSEYGQVVLHHENINPEETDSLVLVEDDKVFVRSTAALRIARNLDGIWKFAAIFLVVPRPIRDFCYDLFAKYRYRIFGKRDRCMIPTQEVRERFIG